MAINLREIPEMSDVSLRRYKTQLYAQLMEACDTFALESVGRGLLTESDYFECLHVVETVLEGALGPIVFE
jgi:hypothetical protein